MSTDTKKKPITSSMLDELYEELKSLRSQFLYQQNWNYSCQNPGSLWLWEKEIAGRMFRCDESSAIAIEERSSCSRCGYNNCDCDPVDW
jgi:hypothetical protein